MHTVTVDIQISNYNASSKYISVDGRLFSLVSGARDYCLSTVMPSSSIAAANKELTSLKRIRNVERVTTLLW